jgi:hypothetical protein
MTAAATVSVPLWCDTCGSAPCVNPSFCQACRIADATMRPTRTTEPRSRPTPRTTIEAIMWCVRERGPQALHEPANIERLSRCDDATIAEIDARISKLGGGHAR